MAAVKSVYSIILSPLVTEKTTLISPYRQYVFSVVKDSNKIEIKRAIEKVYNVREEQRDYATTSRDALQTGRRQW